MKTINWIKVSECLPSYGEDVLVLVLYKGHPQYHHDVYLWNSKDVWLYGDDPVIAWFPIPDPSEII